MAKPGPSTPVPAALLEALAAVHPQGLNLNQACAALADAGIVREPAVVRRALNVLTESYKLRVDATDRAFVWFDNRLGDTPEVPLHVRMDDLIEDIRNMRFDAEAARASGDVMAGLMSLQATAQRLRRAFGD